MASSPRPLPRSLAAVFTVGDARAAGIPRARLRASDLEAPHRGVRVAARPPGHAAVQASIGEEPGAADREIRRIVLDRIAAYEPIRSASAFYTGRTAVAIYDRLFDHDPGTSPLEVGVLAPARPPRVRGVDGRQLAGALTSVRVCAGLPVASPASVWAGFARELDLRDLVRLGDALVRVPRGTGGRLVPEQQLATIDQLRAASAAPHRRGREALDAALELIRVGSMSPLETDFRLGLGEAGLPEPELDVEIRDAGGRLVGIADGMYREPRVLIEVEGQQHRTSSAQWERDIEKHAAYAALGWNLVRLTGRAVRSGESAPAVGAMLARCAQ